MQEALAALGHPDQRFLAVQVAGTNGKGSICTLVAAALSHAGHRTGLYTSPHLLSWCERLRIDGQSIAPSALKSSSHGFAAQLPHAERTRARSAALTRPSPLASPAHDPAWAWQGDAASNAIAQIDRHRRRARARRLEGGLVIGAPVRDLQHGSHSRECVDRSDPR